MAVIPSALRTDRHALRIVRLTYRGKPLREPLAIFWDKRRPLPRYATALLRNAGGVHAQGLPNHAAVRAQARHRGAANGDAPPRASGTPVAWPHLAMSELGHFRKDLP